MNGSGCHVEALLARYVDDELSATESMLVEGHVGRCPSCAARLQDDAQQWVEMSAFAEALESEQLLSPAPNRTPGWRWPRLAWPSMFVSAALMLAVCDRAAMREAVDAASVAPGSMHSLAARVAVDETRPGCEESTWLGPDALAEGPVCAESLTLALATFPPDDDDELDWSGESAVCVADDGGDLACMPDEPV
jgi:hypothetical protein